MQTDKPSEQDLLKQAAAEFAAEQIEDGMLVGLGSGSTARMLVTAIGARVRQGLKLIGVPTSELTGQQAKELNIPIATLADYPTLDLTIDGADDVELGTLNLIKGGGGNQLREKIVANASRRMVVIVDESKVVQQLGKHPVPVEVAQFGWQATARILTELKGNPTLRMRNASAFVTDGGNYILDCDFGPIPTAADLARQLDSVVGVMEHGLFIGMASLVLVGGHDGVKQLTRSQ